MDQSKAGLSARVTSLPEFNIYVFAFLLNFVWEFLQMPLFTAPPADMPHWDIVKIYAFASVADGFIMLIAYWMTSAFARSRYWFVAAERGHVLIFLIIGLAITSAIELIATEMGVWTYSPLMPVLFGVGLSPFIQWVIPPLITLWFTRRQLGV
jgi:hypothetical protein